MEIEELSNSTALEDIWRYAITRFDGRVVLLLPAWLIACSRWPRGSWTTSLLASDWLLCLAWIAAFRLADDLADRDLDRRRRPDRVLCRTSHLSVFHVLLLFLLAIAALATLMLRDGASLVMLIVYAALLKAWYLGRGKLAASAICNYHMVLLKYAAITLVLIGSRNWLRSENTWLAAFIAYGALCVWEVVHDADLRGSSTARRIAAAEFLLVVLASLLAASLNLTTS